MCTRTIWFAGEYRSVFARFVLGQLRIEISILWLRDGLCTAVVLY